MANTLAENLEAAKALGARYALGRLLLAEMRTRTEHDGDPDKEALVYVGGLSGRIRKETDHEGLHVWNAGMRFNQEPWLSARSRVSAKGAVELLRMNFDKRMDKAMADLHTQYREWLDAKTSLEDRDSKGDTVVRYYEGPNGAVIMLKLTLEANMESEGVCKITGFHGVLCAGYVKAEVDSMARLGKVLKDFILADWLDRKRVVREMAEAVRAKAVEFAGEAYLSPEFLASLTDKEKNNV